MFNLKIRGFRCNEETDGLGSDSIAFFLAALPLTKHSSRISGWTYAAGYRDYRLRWADDMDTGEAFVFQYPMSINERSSSDYDALEVIMVMLEIDGSARNKNQALRIERTMRDRIERACLPNVGLGSYPEGPFGVGSYDRVLRPNGRNSGSSFAGEDLVALDLWHIDLDTPLSGSIDWTKYSREQQTPESSLATLHRAYSIERNVYKNRRGDGSLSETRSYRSNEEDSRYTFEVEYTDV
ncbi:MAG: hypothetical protein WA952_05980 [Lewinella sp.]